MSEQRVCLKNPHLASRATDYLYHLGINVEDTKDASDIQKRFGDVKFVCMGGTIGRMRALAKYLMELLEGSAENEDALVDLSEHAGRYAMFKVGPVLCCSHGLGISSFSVLLHELLKLTMYAKCVDPVFIRLGTSGGIDIDPGTVVVTKAAFNGYLENVHELAVLGERVRRPALFDEGVIQELLRCQRAADNFKIISGNTMAAECFYEGQGRLDGASCSYDNEAKMEFLRRCYALGIRNIEMEATMFAALTHHIGVRAADVCVTLVNRLNGDQLALTQQQKEEFEQRPMLIVGRYILQALKQ